MTRILRFIDLILRHIPKAWAMSEYPYSFFIDAGFKDAKLFKNTQQYVESAIISFGRKNYDVTITTKSN
jgi:hypothetical protein